MKNLKIIILMALAICVATTSSAVTKEEMDHARAIATQCYLRYANNGSGYLDEFEAKSMAELEGKLKDKEKQNLKAFKAIPVPGDYASWDKAKLVEYWGKTAFATPGLEAEGLKGAPRARGRLNKLTVTAPVKEEPKPESKPEPKPSVQETPADQPVAEAAPAATPEAATAEVIAAETEAEAEANAEDPHHKKNTDTWIYVIILVVLVIAVIWLVVYASNTMKAQEQEVRREKRRRQDAEEAVSAMQTTDMPQRDGYDGPTPMSVRTTGEMERDQLRAQLDDTLSKYDELYEYAEKLKREYDRMSADLNDAREQAEKFAAINNGLQQDLQAALSAKEAALNRAIEAEGRLTDLRAAAQRQREELAQVREQSASQRGETARVNRPQSTPEAPAAPAGYKPRQAPQRPERSIYLGRANNRGIFVRADRMLNPEYSLFKLVTSDGINGTFTIADDPEVVARALADPMQMLANACVGRNIESTDGVDKILTVTPGAAVFEGGCWKVSRKAHIAYT